MIRQLGLGLITAACLATAASDAADDGVLVMQGEALSHAAAKRYPRSLVEQAESSQSFSRQFWRIWDRSMLRGYRLA